MRIDDRFATPKTLLTEDEKPVKPIQRPTFSVGRKHGEIGEMCA
jgi:hypothetical protein